jgi:predicted ATPase with chaperone activity
VHPILALEQTANEDLNALQKRLNRNASFWLRTLEEKTPLSFRRLSNLLKVSRTIALLDERESIEAIDLEEAWSLRSPEVLI